MPRRMTGESPFDPAQPAGRISYVPGPSNVEPEVHHVAIAHDVVLAFEPQLAGFFRALLAVELDVIFVRYHFGADETFIEIGVDHARRLRRRFALVHRPRAHFLRPRS